MSENKETIAAVVVTYNRKQLLGECLDALLNQTYPLDAVYIIDNASIDGTPEYLTENNLIDKPLYPNNEPQETVKSIPVPAFINTAVEIHYVRMHENTGGAGGFYEGTKRGYEANYDWLWVMDDDAEPMSDCLEILMKACSDDKLLAVCPLIYGAKSGKVQFYHHKFLRKGLFLKEQKIKEFDYILKKTSICIDANAYVGPLIHRNIIRDVGYPNKDYFLWVDDKDYTYRISRKYKLVLIPRAVIKHKDDNVLNASERIPVSVYWKQYYGIRNSMIFESVYNRKVSGILLGFYLLMRLWFGILFYKDNYMKYRMKVLLWGFIDGLRSSTGKNEKVFFIN